MHSGDDFEAAARTVLGYTQETKKGRTIEVSVVAKIATASLKSKIESILHSMVITPFLQTYVLVSTDKILQTCM